MNKDINQLVDFFKFLSCPFRLRIIVLLAQKDLCVGEIEEITGKPQSAVSQKLGKLRDLRFVTSKHDGKCVYYHLDIENEVIKQIIKVITENLTDYPEIVHDSLMLKTMGDK